MNMSKQYTHSQNYLKFKESTVDSRYLDFGYLE